MEKAAIIVAGGSGTRIGGSIPKQFQLLQGRPMLCWTIEAFHRHDPDMQLIVVLPEAHVTMWKALCIAHGFLVPHTAVVGGDERFHSVRNGLAAVTGDPIVAVHDGARPMVSSDLIARCFAAAEEQGNAIPAIAVTTSMRMVNGAGSQPLERTQLRNIQTPQCFRAGQLRKAFEQDFDPSFTDEATLVERSGVAVHLVEGDDHNVKVTTPLDLHIVEMLLTQG